MLLSGALDVDALYRADGGTSHRELADHPGVHRVASVDDPDHLIETFRTVDA